MRLKSAHERNSGLSLQSFDWMAQAARDHHEWLRAKAPHLTDQQREANDAGFEAGWQEAVRTLKLHGRIR